jgi:hypothetical protein
MAPQAEEPPIKTVPLRPPPQSDDSASASALSPPSPVPASSSAGDSREEAEEPSMPTSEESRLCPPAVCPPGPEAEVGAVTLTRRAGLRRHPARTSPPFPVALPQEADPGAAISGPSSAWPSSWLLVQFFRVLGFFFFFDFSPLVIWCPHGHGINYNSRYK